MERGYSFIELLIVISLITMIAGMAALKIGDWQAHQDLNAAARQLASDIRLLQQVTVNVDARKGTPVMSLYEKSYSAPLSPVPIKRTFPSTVSIVKYDTIIFSAKDGTPTVVKTITIRRTDLKGSRDVIVDSVGRVRIQ